MEIQGEVNIEIDQYADVSIEIDTEDLAETLCQDHDLVDDVRMGEFFHSSVENMVQNEIDDLEHSVNELRVNVAHAQAEFEGELQDLRDQVSELEPDRDTSTGLTPEEFHTLVADIAKEIARGEICVALADAHKKMQARLNGEA